MWRGRSGRGGGGGRWGGGGGGGLRGRLDGGGRGGGAAGAGEGGGWGGLGIEEQRGRAGEAERHWGENLEGVRGAVERHERTMVDLPAAETAAREARTVVLGLEMGLRKQ